MNIGVTTDGDALRFYGGEKNRVNHCNRHRG